MKSRIEISSHFLARPLSKSGEADILSPQDRFEMLDLLHTVSWCIDAGDYGVLATIVCEDFTHDHPWGAVSGRDNFIQFLQTNPQYFEGIRTQNHNVLLRSVDLSNSLVASQLVMTAVADARAGTTASGPAVIAHGICLDNLRKEKEIWKLAKRTVDQMSVAEAFMPDGARRAFFALSASERQKAMAAR